MIYLVGFILADGADISAALISQKEKKKALSLTFSCNFVEITALWVTASDTTKNFSDLITLLLPMKAFLFPDNDFGN